MKDKKIVVLLKYFKGELNPFDGAALECALSMGAKDITALTMAPKSALEPFKGITRLGVKCVMISDPVYAGSDTQATSFILAEALKRLNPDLVFCGRQSVDGDTAQVPPMIAKRLGFDIRVKAMGFEGNRITLRSGESFTLSVGTVVTFEKIRTLRFPSMFSRMGEVEIWDNSTLGLPVEGCGLKGSPTRVIKSYESSVGRRDCKFVDLKSLPRLIDEGLKKSLTPAQTVAEEKLEEVYFVGNVEYVASGIAKKAVRLEIEGSTPERAAEILGENKAKIVLWEDDERLKILASQTAVLTGAGICADCISFKADNGRLVMTRPALGGNVTADIVCDSDMTFATVRTPKRGSSDLIFSVGKGAIDQIEKIDALAKKYNAEVCSSRIVADSGKLPYETQVGLTGRTVNPKVYVAFGLSGAVQHTCSISGAGTVIAVNVDKNARIFDYADYGIIAEVKNVEL